MKKTVFKGQIIPVEVIEVVEPGNLTGIVITDHLHDAVAHWTEPDKAKVLEITRALAIALAKKIDDGEIEWEVLEEVF